jgi:hypothetical protein
MKDAGHSLVDASSSDVRSFLEEVKTEDHLWSEADLGDVLSHQWSTPLEVDLSGMDGALSQRVNLLAKSKGLLLRSFGDLMEHPKPPLELLGLTKEFAKRCICSPHSPVPHDVARVLYFASIATALCRCRKRITTLSDGDVMDGISWSLSRDWLPEGARNVLTSGLEALKDAEEISS